MELGSVAKGTCAGPLLPDTRYVDLKAIVKDVENLLRSCGETVSLTLSSTTSSPQRSVVPTIRLNVAAICPNCHARVTHNSNASGYSRNIKTIIDAKEAQAGAVWRSS